MDELIHDFGVLPDNITLENGGLTRATTENRVRFRLELWRTPNQFGLRHHRQNWGLGMPDDSQYLKLMWMRPAKGPGFGELRWGAKTIDFPTLLLSGCYDDLSWLRTVAEKLSEILEISLQTYDMGSDY